jgi:threonine dehydrogenase-like Zn-dependent dehydrogenase
VERPQEGKELGKRSRRTGIRDCIGKIEHRNLVTGQASKGHVPRWEWGASNGRTGAGSAREFSKPIERGEALAKKLGAFAYVDSKATKVAEELRKLGGAKVILATAPSAKAMADTIDGLAVSGKLVVLGAPFEPMEVNVVHLLMARRAIQGWPSRTAMDSQDTLEFAKFAGVRPMVEKFLLEKVSEAFARMESGKAEFRVVLTM